MARDAEGVAQSAEAAGAVEGLLAPLRDRYGFEVVSFPLRDSTDMTPEDWDAIRQEIARQRVRGIEGMVVTHGTDTLAYAAATLAFLCGPPPLRLPVVLTGSQRTPEAKDYDGGRNFAAACAAAASDLGEVAVVFHGQIWRGCRVEKVSLDDLNGFRSPEPHGLGRVAEDGTVTLHRDAARRGGTPPPPLWEPGVRPADRVLSVAVSPGLDPRPYLEMVRRDAGWRGVVLQGWGAGHVPSRPSCDWVELVRASTERGLPVLLTAGLASGRGRASDYAVGRAVLKAGAIPIGGMVTPAAVMKFRLLIATADRQEHPRVAFVREQMAASAFGERGGRPPAGNARDIVTP